MLISSTNTPHLFQQAVAPITDLMQRSSQSCSVQGCKTRLPAWAGLWGARRGIFVNSEWYCSSDCLAQGLTKAVDSLRSQTATRPAFVNRMPLGLILMARGIITHEQLKLALARRKHENRPIGHILIDQFNLDEDVITQTVASQSSCPVLRTGLVDNSCIQSVPLKLIERFRMIPVHFSSTRKNLYVGFCGLVDRGILYAVEQMLDCHTEPCTIADSTFHLLLESLRSQIENQVVIDTYCRSVEIASMVCDYSAKTRDACIRYTAVGESIWVRVLGRHNNIDLIFARYPNSFLDSAPLKVEPVPSR